MILLFTLPESAIRSPVQVYHSSLTVPFQLPDISHSCHPLGLVLRRTTTSGCVHRALHILRANPRVCCRCLRVTFLANPSPQWIIPVYPSDLGPTHVAHPDAFCRNYQRYIHVLLLPSTAVYNIIGPH